MALYIDSTLINNQSVIPADVINYVVKRHQNEQQQRLQMLETYYKTKNEVQLNQTDHVVTVRAGYPHYIVSSILGFYLGDPVKYENKTDEALSNGIEAYEKNGQIVKHKTWAVQPDIRPILDEYDEQSITDIDNEIGRDLGEFGEAYELIYSNSDSSPRSTVCNPVNSVMVRDNSVEHHKLFFIQYTLETNVNNEKYYIAYVYTSTTSSIYKSDASGTLDFSLIEGSVQQHLFGEVPVVEYQNGADRIADFETSLSLIDAYNVIMSDRVTDKEKFIDAILCVFGAELDENDIDKLRDHRMLNLPLDAKVEYAQKVLNESDLHILASDLIAEIHKQSMTVDMSDSAFGTASGQALKLKLLSLLMLVKTKIRSFSRGLKKRFEIYNRFLNIKNNIVLMDKRDLEPVFTINIPIDETAIVNMVKNLQGIVDRKTLLQQLWFVRDPEAVLKKVEEEEQSNNKKFIDTFGINTDTQDKDFNDEKIEKDERE